MQDKIQNIIFKALINLADELENETLKSPTKDTKIYGIDAQLDSLALVSLITDIEEMIDQEFGKPITLADEKAMSARHSPFKDVATLTAYIQTLLS